MSAEAWSAVAAAISALGGVAAVVVAVYAWRAAQRAADAAAAMTEIERRRLHHDMAPEFGVSFDPADVGDHGTLLVRFVGPPTLVEVSIGLRVRNDRKRVPVVTGKATPEELDAQLWGPYRFTMGHYREAGPFDLQVGDGQQFDLSKTSAPHWTTEAWWKDNIEGKPVRLALQCTHPGFEPWIIHLDVATNSS